MPEKIIENPLKRSVWESNFVLNIHLIFLNILMWLPFMTRPFPTIGLGHDSQLFTAAINAQLRTGNYPWDVMLRLFAAREDVYGYALIGLLYPFYWTLGVVGDFSYDQNLTLDFLSVVFHTVVACFLFAYFLKLIMCRNLIAACGGISYAYCMHIKMWSSWMWGYSGFTWIPLCLIGVWYLVVEKKFKQGLFATSFGFGLIALGTSLPIVYALILSATLSFACWLHQGDNYKKIFFDSIKILFAGITGALLSATHLIPSLVKKDEYIRWYSGGSITGGLKPPYEGTIGEVIHLESLIQLFVPTLNFSGVGHLYVGIALISFSIWLLIDTKWRKFALPFMIASLYFLLDAFGDATIIHRITYHIPLISSIRYPLANVTIMLVSIIILGSIGAELFCRINNNSLKKIFLSFLALASLLIFIYEFFNKSSLMHDVRLDKFILLASPAVAAIAAILLLYVDRLRTLINYIPVLLLVSYLPINSLLVHPKIPDQKTLYNQCDDFVNLNDSLRQWGLKYGDDTRLAIIWDPKAEVPSCLKHKKMSNSLLGSLAMMSGWDVLYSYVSPRPIREFYLWSGFSRKLDSYDNILKAGVSHILVNRKISRDNTMTSYIIEVEQVGAFTLYEVVDWGVGQTLGGCLKPQETSILLITNKGNRKIELPKNRQDEMISKFRCLNDNPELIINNKLIKNSLLSSDLIFEVNSNQELLFVSERVQNINWLVNVKDRIVETYEVDGYRLAFGVPQGQSLITLSYRPKVFYLGALLSIFGLLVLMFVAFDLGKLNSLRNKGGGH